MKSRRATSLILFLLQVYLILPIEASEAGDGVFAFSGAGIVCIVVDLTRAIRKRRAPDRNSLLSTRNGTTTIGRTIGVGFIIFCSFACILAQSFFPLIGADGALLTTVMVPVWWVTASRVYLSKPYIWLSRVW